jgi:hypothetical protein
MIVPRYAGIGVNCPLFDLSVLSGGQLTAATKYFSFQLQNRCGFNLPSVSSAIAVTTNSKVRITIPDFARKPAWDIHYFIISCGNSADVGTHVQIARVPGYQFGAGISPQSVIQDLPYILELTRDEHLALAPSVAAVGNLPTGSDRLDGQVRYVNSLGFWLEYRADSTLPISVEVVQADIGQWVRIGGASTYVSSTETGVGCDRDLRLINPTTTIRTPPYPANNRELPDWEAKYWLYNDDDYPLSAGTDFGVELGFNNKRSPDLLSGLFVVRFLGFVRADGTYRTEDAAGRDYPNLGGYFTWNPRTETPFSTIDDLIPGEAIALGVRPFFSIQELNNQVPPQSVINIVPSIRTQSGDYNPLGKLIPEGVVYAEADLYRVVPGTGLSVKVLAGMALIGSYDFPEKPIRYFSFGLSLNSAGQKVVINGSGAVFLKPASYVLSSSEALRAIVGTVVGESNVCDWSDYVAISATQGVDITVNYPCDANGTGTIRDDYPDVIAGNAKAEFNAPKINIYLQRQDTQEIRLFSGFSVITLSSQSFYLSTWTDGVVITSLPISSSDFSLFEPISSSVVSASSGVFPATNYRVCVSFQYDGGQITSISHENPPCIKEFSGNFAAIFDSNVYIESQEDSLINALIFG